MPVTQGNGCCRAFRQEDRSGCVQLLIQLTGTDPKTNRFFAPCTYGRDVSRQFVGDLQIRGSLKKPRCYLFINLHNKGPSWKHPCHTSRHAGSHRAGSVPGRRQAFSPAPNQTKLKNSLTHLCSGRRAPMLDAQSKNPAQVMCGVFQIRA